MNNIRITTLLICLLMSFAFLSHAQKKGKLTIQEKEKIRNSTVSFYLVEDPKPYIMTPKSALLSGGGLLGGLIQSKIGSDSLGNGTKSAQYQIGLDLRVMIDSLMQAMDLIPQLQIMSESFPFESHSNWKKIERYEDDKSDYILEILGSWGAVYKMPNIKQYRLSVGGRIRIIRNSDKSILWNEFTDVNGSKNKNLQFHIDDLENNGNEKLAAMLNLGKVELSKKIIEKYISTKK